MKKNTMSRRLAAARAQPFGRDIYYVFDVVPETIRRLRAEWSAAAAEGGDRVRISWPDGQETYHYSGRAAYTRLRAAGVSGTVTFPCGSVYVTEPR